MESSGSWKSNSSAQKRIIVPFKNHPQHSKKIIQKIEPKRNSTESPAARWKASLAAASPSLTSNHQPNPPAEHSNLAPPGEYPQTKVSWFSLWTDSVWFHFYLILPYHFSRLLQYVEILEVAGLLFILTLSADFLQSHSSKHRISSWRAWSKGGNRECLETS